MVSEVEKLLTWIPCCTCVNILMFIALMYKDVTMSKIHS